MRWVSARPPDGRRALALAPVFRDDGDVDRRGAHPKDADLFAGEMLPRLRKATDDLSWMLGRGYGLRAAQPLVGERYALAARQRDAVGRAACAPDVATARRSLVRSDLGGGELWIDGFNVLIISERVLGEGPVILGRDGAYRDIAGLHGTWRRTAQTVPAVRAIAKALTALGVGRARWLLDRPVANAGRLAALLRGRATESNLAWTIEAVDRVDRRLAESGAVVATSDGWIIDRCRGWMNVVRGVIDEAPNVWIVEV